MHTVLTDPSVPELLRAEPARAPEIYRECWRWECPLTWVLRRCTTRTRLAGQELAPGDLVCVNLASANRDETRWSRPDRFDVRREPLPSLAMGTGPHACLGRHLAAVEAGELLAELTRTLTETWPRAYVLDAGGIAGRGFRSPRRLAVRL